jgi:coenzyme F420-dependent glucose-6-phosphate dehydrogenase
MEREGVSPIEFGYRAEQEGHQPSLLLKLARLARQAGFQFMPISDHFHPWFHTGAAGGFAWTWISAAAASVPDIRFGPMVAAPIGRYHPAIIAQSFATMDEMFPGRFFLGLGTGEAMNEVPLGYPWPKFEERLERVKEAVEIIRALWSMDFVKYEGKYYSLNGANLYTKPRTSIPIYLAANGPKAAALVGQYADGYVTINPTLTRFKELWSIIERTARDSGRDPAKISKHIELFVSYGEDYDRAVKAARKWKSGLIPEVFNSGIYDPRELEKRGNAYSDSELAKVWTAVTSKEEIIKKAEDAIALGFNEIEFHCAGAEEEFLEACRKDVLPYLAAEYVRS